MTLNGPILVALDVSDGDELLHQGSALALALGEVLVVRGPAAPGIIGAAVSEGASLVVAGTRGRSGLPCLLLGSVADSVMRDAPCSVLAVPLHTDAPPEAAAA